MSSLSSNSITDPVQVSLMFEQKSKNIAEAYATLNQIVERHEATIQKRWLGKTRPAKLKILLNAWPGMPLNHRPDLKAVRQLELTNKKEADAWQRGAFLWPHINQEDLSKPRTLLLLLNSRGRNLPSVFADMDTASIAPSFQYAIGGYKFELNDKYSVSLSASTPQTYGKLQISTAPTAGTDKVWPPVSNAFSVLEAQERVLKFLASVCRAVLHDIALIPMISDDEAYPVQPEPRLNTEASTGPFDSTATVAAEAAYRVPETPTIDRIVSLLATLKAAAQAKITALREDPSYFAASVDTLREHNVLQIKLENGKEHPDLKGSNGNRLWLAVLRHIVASSYESAELYAQLHAQALELREHLGNFDSNLSTKESTGEYVFTLARLRFYLERAIEAPIADLKQFFPSSQPARDAFVLSPEMSINDEAVHVSQKTQFSESSAATLTWAIMTLADQGRVSATVGISSLVDEAQRAMTLEKAGSDLTTPLVASTVGELSVLVQCLQGLERMQPFAVHVPQKIVDTVKEEFTANYNPLERICDATVGESMHGAAPLINTSNGRFAYPVDKRRTKETVEAMQRAEQNLDEFWTYVDRVMYLKAGNLKDTVALQDLLANPKAMRRTRKWAAPSSAAVTAASAAMAGVQANGNGTANGKANGGGKKKKGKGGAKANGANGANGAAVAPVVGTNGVAATVDSEPELVPLSPFFFQMYKGKAEGSSASSTGSQDGSDDVSAGRAAAIKVDARALKVFRALYFNPDVNSTFGEIAWNDIVNAMSSIGFRAERLYGSLWQFRPTKANAAGVPVALGGGILLNDTFPQTKVSFDGARWIGRRLALAYGWNRDTFVAKSK